jgi:predicted alpha-1,2-mannosidase
MHKYQFPANKAASLVLDLGYAINWDRPADTGLERVGPRLFEGYRHSKGWAPEQFLFFAMYLDVEPDEVRYIKANTLVQDPLEGQPNPNLRLVLTFQNGGTVQVKMGLSSVDKKGAVNNVQTELPHWDFAKVRKESAKAWDRLLSRVQATHVSDDDAKIFDTALYHAFIAPNTFSDVDGNYRGIDGSVYQVDGFTYYSTFSLWDTFRAAHPLFTLLVPERVDGFVKSMLALFKQNAQLPMWGLWNDETECMIGYHAVPVLADAYLKGLTSADSKEILDACVSTADTDLEGLEGYKKVGRVAKGMKSYMELGFVEASVNESCAKTLEYAFDDSAIARLAKALGNQEIEERFRGRAMNYRNLFDPETGFMRGKHANGTWVEPFDPIASDHRNSPYCEGNAWQWAWYVPHNPSGLVELFGGAENYAAKLDQLFEMSSEMSGENISPDISGMIGQYAHGNEPSHHTAYMYVWAGQPWKTQARVRQIMAEQYKTGPEGLSGNDDCGQMSAWYIFSALGFYPVDPASGIYVLGSPRVKTAKLAIGKAIFEVKAENQSAQNVYVQSVTLNGKALNRAYITHDEITKGGKLVFSLGPAPNTDLVLEPPPGF